MKTPKVRQRNDTWVITYTFQGKQIHHYSGYDSLELNQRIANLIKADIEANAYDVSRDRYTTEAKRGRAQRRQERLDKAFKRVIPSPWEAIEKRIASNALKPATERQYVMCLDIMRKCTQSDSNYIRSYLEGLDLKHSVKNRTISIISASYKALGIKWEIPVRFEEYDRNDNINTIPRALADSEIAAIRQKMRLLPASHWAFTELALATGARPSELIALTWGDYNPSQSTLLINKNVTIVDGCQVLNKGTKTSNHRGKGSRVFPVNDDLKALLHEIERYTGTEDLIIPSLIKNKKYFYYPHYKVKLEAICKDAKIPKLTPYNFRDTFILRQIAAGVAIEVVAAWVGNSPGEIRRSYLNQNQVAQLDIPRSI